MTYLEAVVKAETSKGPAISITEIESAKNMIGKTLGSPDPKNTNLMQIVANVNGNYILQINGGENYAVSPVAHTLNNLHRMRII